MDHRTGCSYAFLRLRLRVALSSGERPPPSPLVAELIGLADLMAAFSIFSINACVRHKETSRQAAYFTHALVFAWFVFLVDQPNANEVS